MGSAVGVGGALVGKKMHEALERGGGLASGVLERSGCCCGGQVGLH